MRFSVERDGLLAALSHAHRIVARTDAIPILGTVLIRTDSGRLIIMATSTEMVAETSCAAEVETDGQVAVPLAPLVELMRRLPAGTAMAFACDGDEGELKIRYRRSSAALPTLAAGDFVTFGIDDESFELEIEGQQLARLFEVPAHIADAQSPWAFGVGVHLHFVSEHNALVGVATDQKRLTRVMLPAAPAAYDLPSITLALKPIAEIVKLAKDVGAEPLRLRITERLLSVSAGGTTLTTKLVDAIFPAYGTVIPADMPRVSIVAAGELSDALRRTLILADDKDRVVRCEISDGILSMRSRSMKGGAISETIEVEGGDGIIFGLNATMAIEALSAIDADVIELASASPSSPIVFRARGSSEVTCLVMPLKG